MDLLDSRFDRLITCLDSGSTLSPMSADPFYCLVYPTQMSVLLKRRMSVLCARLKKHGFEPRIFSLGQYLHQLLQNNPMRDIWELHEEDSGALEVETIREINRSIAQLIQEPDGLVDTLIQELSKASQATKGILILTDLELLHPYLRISAIGEALQGKITVPTVAMYPGTRTGQFGLKFLDFYPENGNYRFIFVE